MPACCVETLSNTRRPSSSRLLLRTLEPWRDEEVAGERTLRGHRRRCPRVNDVADLSDLGLELPGLVLRFGVLVGERRDQFLERRHRRLALRLRDRRLVLP